MDDKVTIYEARYTHIDDDWEFYPEDDIKSIADLFKTDHRTLKQLELTFDGDLKVAWRCRKVSEDEAAELEEAFYNWED